MIIWFGVTHSTLPTRYYAQSLIIVEEAHYKPSILYYYIRTYLPVVEVVAQAAVRPPEDLHAHDGFLLAEVDLRSR